MIRSLLVKGLFSERDLAELLAAFRAVERKQPDKPFLFAILESDMTMQAAQQMLRRTFPRIVDDEPNFQTVALRMQVVCPDGQSRSMIPDMPLMQPDIDNPTLLMMQGTVEIDGQTVRGEAWRKNDGCYYFNPQETRHDA